MRAIYSRAIYASNPDKDNATNIGVIVKPQLNLSKREM